MIKEALEVTWDPQEGHGSQGGRWTLRSLGTFEETWGLEEAGAIEENEAFQEDGGSRGDQGPLKRPWLSRRTRALEKTGAR